MSQLIVFGKSPIVAQAEGVEGAGTPTEAKTSVNKYFVHPSGNMSVGIWDCQAGSWTIEAHPNNELCVIIEGGANIVDGDGESFDVKTGDAFVLRQGLKTTWTVDNYVKKIYTVVNGLED